MLSETLDGAAFAGGVTSLENDDVLEPKVLAPVLELQQFDLQAVLLDLVLIAGHPLLVGIVLVPRLHR
ncbi:hypothetical protein D3C73_1432110 [compost metagenome]